MYPTDRRYSKDHEWILMNGDTATLGITDYAQSQLGDIVYVELPDEGKQVAKGDVIGTIESVKAVSEIYSPLAGSVVTTNRSLDDAPEKVNGSPHDEGWYCKLKLDDPSEVNSLMDAAGYEAFVESQ